MIAIDDDDDDHLHSILRHGIGKLSSAEVYNSGTGHQGQGGFCGTRMGQWPLEKWRTFTGFDLSHRIHGAGILMGSMLPYIAYMDPMGMENSWKFTHVPAIYYG